MVARALLLAPPALAEAALRVELERRAAQAQPVAQVPRVPRVVPELAV